MKKIIAYSFFTLFLASCNSNKDSYFLNVDIAGVKDGQQVILKTLDENNRYVNVDTTVVELENFFFEGKADSPLMHYVFINGLNGSVPVVVENGNIGVTAYKDSLHTSVVEGTKSNEEFRTYLTETRKIYGELTAIRTDFATASRNQDTQAMTELRTTFEAIQKKAQNFDLEFVTNNTESYVATLVLERILDTKSQPIDTIKKVYNSFSPALKSTVSGKNTAKKLAALGASEIGAIASNFTAKTPDGNELALNDVIGKVTIIDFWASWCKPCRVENPNVVAMYNRLHEKGLNIIGVSLDKDANKWKQAIEDDQLTWNHVSNLQFWQDPIARQYNVTAIPQTFILDENGTIVDKNLRGAELEKRIVELLAK
jgi:peroxiredoxin